MILRRRGLSALERATNTTSNLRWFSAEGNKSAEEDPGTNTDGKIDFGKNINPASLLRILHYLCYLLSKDFILKSHVSPTSLFLFTALTHFYFFKQVSPRSLVKRNRPS